MRIITNPTTAWCAGCLQSWRQDMIAIEMPLTGTIVSPIFCYSCVAKAAKLGADEKQRRIAQRAAVYGDPHES